MAFFKLKKTVWVWKDYCRTQNNSLTDNVACETMKLLEKCMTDKKWNARIYFGEYCCINGDIKLR